MVGAEAVEAVEEVVALYSQKRNLQQYLVLPVLQVLLAVAEQAVLEEILVILELAHQMLEEQMVAELVEMVQMALLEILVLSVHLLLVQIQHQ
jgi:hypothetical protein